MPPTILYICGGMAIVTIAAYAIFDLSRPYHEREAEKEAKRKAKAKAKNKRLTDAVIAYATQKDAETKAFLEKNREPLTYFNPPEDNAEPACNETDVPMQADPDAKPNAEENNPAEIQELPEEIIEETLEEISSEEPEKPSIADMPTEEITRRVIDGIRATVPTSEISEPEIQVHEISHIKDTIDPGKIIENLPQDNPELLEEDDFTEPEIEKSASSDQAELAPDPTGFNSEADPNPKTKEKPKKKHGFKLWGKKKNEPEPEPTEAEPESSMNLRNSEDFTENGSNTEQSEPQIKTNVVTNDEPNTETNTEPLEEVETTESDDFQGDTEDTADPAEYDFSEAQQNPYIGPESQPEVLPEENESEIYQEQDDNFPNEFPNEESPAKEQVPAEDFNGKILHLHKTENGLEYHPEDEHQLPEDAWQGYPEIQNTPEGDVHDFEPGAEPGPDNIIQMPADWYKGVPEEEEDIPNNITPLYTEYANQVPDEWKDYPDTEIIPEDTTDNEIPNTDSFISTSPNNEDPNKHTDEE